MLASIAAALASAALSVLPVSTTAAPVPTDSVTCVDTSATPAVPATTVLTCYRVADPIVAPIVVVEPAIDAAIGLGVHVRV